MSKKLSYKYVKEYIENFNYILLDKIYINSSTKMNMACSIGHKIQKTFNNFKSGNRCQKCQYEKQKLTHLYVKKIIEKQNYKLLSNIYSGVKIKLKIQCPEGHVYKQVFNNFQQGARCFKCFGTPKYSYLYIKKFIEEQEYKLLSKKYTNTYEKLILLCQNGHTYNVSFGKFKQGRRCVKCSNNGTSKVESEIKNFIKQISEFKIYENNRSILNGKELDIYIPKLKLGIEFNGSYWHSSFKIGKEYHQNKSLLAYQNNIKLIHIYEKDWTNKPNKIKKKLNKIIYLLKNNKVKLPKNNTINLDYQIYEQFQIVKKLKPTIRNNKYKVYNAGKILIKKSAL